MAKRKPGVWYRQDGQRAGWYYRIQIDGKRAVSPRFDTEAMAARAYKAARLMIADGRAAKVKQRLNMERTKLGQRLQSLPAPPAWWVGFVAQWALDRPGDPVPPWWVFEEARTFEDWRSQGGLGNLASWAMSECPDLGEVVQAGHLWRRAFTHEPANTNDGRPHVM